MILTSIDDSESHQITVDETAQTDWQARLQKGLRELDEGKGIELEAFLSRNRKRKRRIPKRPSR